MGEMSRRSFSQSRWTREREACVDASGSRMQREEEELRKDKEEDGV